MFTLQAVKEILHGYVWPSLAHWPIKLPIKPTLQLNEISEIEWNSKLCWNSSYLSVILFCKVKASLFQSLNQNLAFFTSLCGSLNVPLVPHND